MEGTLIKRKNGDYNLKINNSTFATTNQVLRKQNNIKELSLKNCQAIERGYDLDELAKNRYPIENTGAMFMPNRHEVTNIYRQEGFIEGAKTILELLGDKKFSIEDIQNVIDSNEDSLVWVTVNEDGGDIKFYLDEDILTESLQENEWNVEIEIDICGDKVYAVPELVLDTDNCLILKRK